LSARGHRLRREETSRLKSESEGLRELDRAREPLLRELGILASEPGYDGGEPPHVCCLRPRNMMTITPLEAAAVVRALRTKPALRRALPRIRARTRRELARLAGDGTRESSYTRAGWAAVRRRNALNDDVYGKGWAERLIPLALASALGAVPARTRGL
jgi:hypothetical protein